MASKKGPKSTILGLRMRVEGHLATPLSQDSVLDPLKEGSASERDGSGRNLGGGPMSNILSPTNRISPPRPPLITIKTQILEYWNPGSHFSRSEDWNIADLLI